MTDGAPKIIETERVLKALGNRRRLAILQLLQKRGAMTVGIIAERIGLSFAATSRHLRILANAALLDSKQTNTNVAYSLPKSRPAALDTTLKTIA